MHIWKRLSGGQKMWNSPQPNQLLWGKHKLCRINLLQPIPYMTWDDINLASIRRNQSMARAAGFRGKSPMPEPSCMECMDIRKFLRVLLQLAKIVMPLFSLFPFTREHTHLHPPPLQFIARFSHLLDGRLFSPAGVVHRRSLGFLQMTCLGMVPIRGVHRPFFGVCSNDPFGHSPN